MKIKKTISIMLTLVSVIIIWGCNKDNETLTKASNPSWKVISEIQTAYPNYSSYFLNEKIGITVGASGEIHFTTDGGKKWGNGFNNSLCLFDVSMINEKTAWACGNGTYVVRTMNGGASWKEVSSFGEYEPNHPRFINFIDENTGWIATPKEFKLNGKNTRLGYTKDGGNTWDRLELPRDIGNVVAISLRTQNDGYVLDDVGNLYITKDEGKNFSKHSADLKDIDYSICDSPSIALKFLDDNNALICYHSKDGRLQAARSKDGGKTWVNETMPEIYGGSLNLSSGGDILSLTSGDGSLKILSYN